jgi:hypothetical protein
VFVFFFQCCSTLSCNKESILRCAPEERGVRRVVCAALAVRAAIQRHDVVPPLLHEHPDDALDAVADEHAAEFIGLFLHFDQLAARAAAEVAEARLQHDRQVAKAAWERNSCSSAADAACAHFEGEPPPVRGALHTTSHHLMSPFVMISRCH